MAIGINDIAGTGLYGAEYIVSSYGLGNLDMHFGIGWGALNGANKFKNPLIYIDKRFENRPKSEACFYCEDRGGQFSPSRYFSGKEVSPFFGISYAFNKSILLKIENDSTLTPGLVGYEESKSSISFGIDYQINKNFSVAVAKERKNY